MEAETTAKTIEWIIPLITSLAAVVGVVIGSGLQYLFSRAVDTRKHERILRLESYADYMRSVGEAEMLATTTDLSRRNEILASAISAKARVCIHGSAKVISALEKFEDENRGAGLTPEKMEYFAAFVNAIRSEANSDGWGSKSGHHKFNIVQKIEMPHNKLLQLRQSKVVMRFRQQGVIHEVKYIDLHHHWGNAYC